MKNRKKKKVHPVSFCRFAKIVIPPIKILLLSCFLSLIIDCICRSGGGGQAAMTFTGPWLGTDSLRVLRLGKETQPRGCGGGGGRDGTVSYLIGAITRSLWFLRQSSDFGGKTFALEEEAQDCWPRRFCSGRVLQVCSRSVSESTAHRDTEVVGKDDETTESLLFSLPGIHILSQKLVLSELINGDCGKNLFRTEAPLRGMSNILYANLPEAYRGFRQPHY